jgi:hypothetical protein
MDKIDENRVETVTLDPIFPKKRPDWRVSYLLPLGHRLCAGFTRRRAGLAEPKLAAASLARGTGLTGTTTGPLDGDTLTLGVDARAGEGTGSSTTIFHRDALCLTMRTMPRG